VPRIPLIFALTLAAQALAAQVPAVRAFEEPFKLTANAELVLLDVSVKDSSGGRISNLAKQNFQVYEDGKLQTITHFGSNDVPVTVGLVIDTSGSMRPKYTDVVSAAMLFLHESNRNDEVFIVNFGDSVSYGLPPNMPFTDDLQRLSAALRLVAPAGRTALNDAILSSLDHLTQGKCEKKALVLISDGGDNSSVHKSEEVMRMVRESHATIYTVGIFDEGDRDQNPGLLRRLSQVSGGQAFFPDKLSELSGICRQIASDIRTRYTIGYVPLRSGELGSLRKINVIALGPGGHKLVVRTRKSYLLPDANQQRSAASRKGDQ
jgi:Ca-activated chloride channel family protein